MLAWPMALLTFALLMSTAGDIGVTWDEPIYATCAENVAWWLKTLLRDPAAAFAPEAIGRGWGLAHEHPPLVRVVSGLGWMLTKAWLPPPLTHRVGNMVLAAALVGLLACWGTRVSGPWAGLFTAAALLTMPRLFFHAHLAALDFPLAAVWTLASLDFYHLTGSGKPLSSPVRPGLWLGLALLTKINSVLLVPFWALWLLLYRRTWRNFLTLFLSLPIAFALLIAAWPWLWADPLGRLREWVQFFRIHFEIRQWFAGRLYVDTPWYLPMVMPLVTTPVALLALAALGIRMEEKGKRTRAHLHPPSSILPSPWVGLHLCGMATVLGYYALPFTAIHDQERLLLPAFVHLAFLAGNGFAALCEWLKNTLTYHASRTAKHATRNTHHISRITHHASPFKSHAACLILAALLLLPGILGIIRLHPFELAYYNALVGGVRGARRLDMETIYFASTYGYFLPYLNELPTGSRLWVMPNSWDVIYYYQLNGLLRDDLVVLRPPGWGSFYDDRGVPSDVGGLESADYALIERRQTTFNAAIPEYAIQLEWASTKRELARLERSGVVLAALYAR